MFDPGVLLVARDLAEEGRAAEAVLMLFDAGHHDPFQAIAPVGAPGQILVCSWGYDQTNIDFYRIVKATAHSVTLCQLAETVVADHEYTVDVVPDCTGLSGPQFTRRIKRSTTTPGLWSVRISDYQRAYLWNGAPCSETGWGYGH